MIVVDTSSLVCVLFGEAEAEAHLSAMESAEKLLISASTALEASIVVEARKGPAGLRELDVFLNHPKTEIVSVDAEQYRIARAAFSAYGKGRHEAGLNYGDLFSYALAKARAAPLLFKGNDFSKTDVMLAV